MTDETWAQRLKRHLTLGAPAGEQATPPGIYPYQYLQGEWPTRFHLRVDLDGAGVLLANAAEAAYLSPTGVQMARLILEGKEESAVLSAMRRLFPTTPVAQVVGDLAQVREIIASLAAPGDNYPVTNLGDPHLAPWSRALAAPLQADMIPAPPEAARPMLQRLWQAGVPQVTFAVQPETTLSDLPLLVEKAEDLGMIAGIRSTAGLLSAEVLEAAAQAGLDHLDLLFLRPAEHVHDGFLGKGDLACFQQRVQQCAELELCPVAVIPVFQGNVDVLESIFESLQRRGVSNLTFFALAAPDDEPEAEEAGALPARSLPQVAAVIEEAAEEAEVRYLWAPPVRFDPARGLVEQMRRGPRTGEEISLRVEADGAVLPPRGGRVIAGNLLSDPWERIWAHPCFARYREHMEEPARCPQCPDLEICVAACVKDPETWSDDRTGGEV